MEDQRSYYARTAASYDDAHVAPGDEHFIALEYALGVMHTVAAESVLDVGAGTGRAVSFLEARAPAMRIEGVEPSSHLREQATARGIHLVDGTGEALPFADQSFDAVVATGVLHHVPDPGRVIAEMQRVARKVIFISDSNRFGQGSTTGGLVKLAMSATGVWNPYMRLKTRGRGHLYSEGDGIFYSYSIFDSVDQVAAWATRTFIIPTQNAAPRRYTGPLLVSQHGLLCGVREPPRRGWAGVEDA